MPFILPAHLFQDVLGRKGDPGALTQQSVATGAQAVRDPARQNEDFPSLFQGKIHRDERPAALLDLR